MPIEAWIGIGITLLLAAAGALWRLSSTISTQRTQIEGMTAAQSTPATSAGQSTILTDEWGALRVEVREIRQICRDTAEVLERLRRRDLDAIERKLAEAARANEDEAAALRELARAVGDLAARVKDRS